MHNRPGLVTAVAVVNIVLGLSCGCFDMATMALPTVIEKVVAHVQKAQDNALATLRQAEKQLEGTKFQKSTDARFARTLSNTTSAQEKVLSILTSPRMKAAYAISGGTGALIQLFFLVSGIGLLGMACWARKLAIGASIAAIVLAVVHPYVAQAFFGDELVQACQSLGAEAAKDMQETVASLEKDFQKMQEEMERDPQVTATPEGKESLRRMRSLVEMTKAQQKRIAPAAGDSAVARWLGHLYTAVLMLLGCAWPVACILMLRTTRVRAAFGS